MIFEISPYWCGQISGAVEMFALLVLAAWLSSRRGKKADNK